MPNHDVIIVIPLKLLTKWYIYREVFGIMNEWAVNDVSSAFDTIWNIEYNVPLKTAHGRRFKSCLRNQQ